MREALRERAFRTLLVAFMRSDLSVEELRELAQELIADPRFSSDFTQFLIGVLERLSSERHEEAASGHNYSPQDWVDATYFLVQRKRVPKRELISLMESIAPEIPSRAAGSMSVKDLLNYFFTAASSAARERFHRALIGGIEDDPYLRGITKRR